MSLRSTSRSLLATAVAASLLASTPALARVADEGGAARAITHAPPVTQSQDLRGEMARDAARTAPVPITPSQDLRGEMARDAARTVPVPLAPLQDLRGEMARDAARPAPSPVTPDAGTPAQPAKALPATTDDGRNRTWLLVLVGLAGAAIAAGGTAGVRSHHRHA